MKMVKMQDFGDVVDELRHEAGKRAHTMANEARWPATRRDPPPMLLFGLGLAVGALIGVLAASLATPFSGGEARRRLVREVERVRKGSEQTRSADGGAHPYEVPAYERTS